jgi:hypothetical protein
MNKTLLVVFQFFSYKQVIKTQTHTHLRSQQSTYLHIRHVDGVMQVTNMVMSSQWPVQAQFNKGVVEGFVNVQNQFLVHINLIGCIKEANAVVDQGTGLEIILIVQSMIDTTQTAVNDSVRYIAEGLGGGLKVVTSDHSHCVCACFLYLPLS